MADTELRYEILRLLRLRGDMGAASALTLKELAQATGRREREVRRVCAVMEALDYIHGRHSAGGDADPSYEITVEGLVMLHKHEHVYGKSFFDEALGSAKPHE
jgi:DNA-binding IclR family transcriptional regulator